MPVQVMLYTPDRELHRLLSAALRPEFELVFESQISRLKLAVSSGQADVIVLDCDSNYSPSEEQFAICDEICDSSVPVVVMADDPQRSTSSDFLQRGAFDCIRKPPSLSEFKIVVKRAYDHAVMKLEVQQMREKLYLTHGFGQLIGSSGRAQVVYDLIRRVANLSAHVLIQGESGTGKELVARAIHQQGNRGSLPFVAVSCGAIPETLIEAELFGHEKGAYTGSNGSRAGYLEQAGEGTLFLDEIGELSLNTQVKLLRVLQEREFTRLGSNRATPLRARVVFATHRNLEKMVELGTFRQDLYFRVNVMTIRVPALRDRTEDIPALARHFLQRYAEEYGKPVRDIRPNALELLVRYEWPGNIRELENVIQGAVILADGESLSRVDLPAHIQQLEEEVEIEEEIIDSDEVDGFEALLRQFKIALATKAISECNGNKSQAARKLRVSRAYLHRLIRMGSGSETSDAA